MPVAISRAESHRAGPASETRLASSIESIRAEIGKALPGAGGRLFSVSPKVLLTEVYLPLRRSGLLEELFVLIPSEKPFAEGDLLGIRNHLSSVGVSGPDVTSFHPKDGTIRGVVEGMPVSFFPLNRIPSGPTGDSVLFLDPDFLLSIYRNEVKTPIIELAWKLVVTLRGKRVPGKVVVLADMLAADDASLRYSFLSSLLGEMVSAPASFDGAFPTKWQILQQAETAAFFSQYAESTLLYRKHLDSNPKDASSCYKIAMAAVRDMDADLALHWLNKAVVVDPRYAGGFVTAAGYLAERKLFDPAERILRGGANAFPKDARMATSLAVFLLMRGERFRESGDDEGAKEYFMMAANVDGADRKIRDKANESINSGREGAPAPSR